MAQSPGPIPASAHHKFNTKTRNTTFMDHEWMTDRRDRNRDRQGLRAAVSRFAVVGVLAAGLGACASGPSSSVFVDPATYELYNCQQLGAARKRSNDRVVELEGLMAKAETGAGGSLVSGLAYQTDYLSERARRDQIDEKITSNNCSRADLAPPAEPAAPPVHPKKRR
ncbi:MAG: hypothetical protein NVV83_22185 [Afipia sp.]|jgi:hypothetical protein|nr:hypothetical protein [Afipia sp.]